MFFYLSKIFSIFLFPYPLFLLLCLVAAWRLPPGRFRRLFAAGLTALILLSSSFVSGELIGLLEDYHPQPKVAGLPPADAVIVLAGMVNALTGQGERPEFLGSADRILAGEELLLAGRAPVLMISGGSGLMLQTGESEARILERWLHARGHEPNQILIEANSRNTGENAVESAKIVRERGWRRVILVTSAFHMPRSMLCFRKAGVEAVAFPVDYYRHRVFAGPEALAPSIGGLRLSTIAIKEYIGIVAYKAKGFI